MRECTVFVIDDDEATRESLEAMINLMGVQTQAFASAEDFLETFDDARPGCILTDLRLNGISGVELQQRLNARNAQIPIIIMSAYADVSIAVKAMQDGAVSLLEKPCAESKLWESIRSALARDTQCRARKQVEDDVRERISQLTAKELPVMEMVVDGIPNKAIAKRENVSLRTVEIRRASVFQKLGVNSVAHLVQKVMLIRHADKAS